MKLSSGKLQFWKWKIPLLVMEHFLHRAGIFLHSSMLWKCLPAPSGQGGGILRKVLLLLQCTVCVFRLMREGEEWSQIRRKGEKRGPSPIYFLDVLLPFILNFFVVVTIFCMAGPTRRPLIWWSSRIILWWPGVTDHLASSGWCTC